MGLAAAAAENVTGTFRCTPRLVAEQVLCTARGCSLLPRNDSLPQDPTAAIQQYRPCWPYDDPYEGLPGVCWSTAGARWSLLEPASP